jgi:D-alanyl-D-alanine carboxypeptidase/D-alanyl-D-alanine-endopeptidase (penicillin-binding protein 4)
MALRAENTDATLRGSMRCFPCSLSALALSLACCSALAQAPPPSARQSANMATAAQTILSAQPASAQAHWGISMVDAATGQTLYALNDGQLFEPASNAKLFTTSTALALLGPGYTTATQVLAEGHIDATGTLHGDLRLVGGGDPTISGRGYPYAGKTVRSDTPLAGIDALAQQVVAHGIHRIDGAAGGAVIGDDTLFPDERYGRGWAWDDLQWEYGAPVTALTVNDNVRFLTVTPGLRPGDPVTTSWMPDLPGAPSGLLVTATTTAQGAKPALGVDRLPESPTLRVFGSLPANGAPVQIALAMSDPAAFAAQALLAALKADGVEVTGGVTVAHRPTQDTESFTEETHAPLVLHPLPAGSSSLSGEPQAQKLVASRQSVPLSQIVTVTLKVSQNLHAEMLMRLLGRAEADDGSPEQGARVVRSFMTTEAGVLPEDFLLYDGSGLSSDDLLTPRSLTTLLRWSTTQPWGSVLRSALPISGTDGSLADRLETLRGRVQAKTGTLGEVHALSGFLIANSGRTVIFSILCNDRPGTGGTTVMDSLLLQAAQTF